MKSSIFEILEPSRKWVSWSLWGCSCLDRREQSMLRPPTIGILLPFISHCWLWKKGVAGEKKRRKFYGAYYKMLENEHQLAFIIKIRSRGTLEAVRLYISCTEIIRAFLNQKRWKGKKSCLDTGLGSYKDEVPDYRYQSIWQSQSVSPQCCLDFLVGPLLCFVLIWFSTFDLTDLTPYVGLDSSLCSRSLSSVTRFQDIWPVPRKESPTKSTSTQNLESTPLEIESKISSVWRQIVDIFN